MKRTLLLAGCLVLLAGCGKKAAPLPQQEGKEADICADKEGHWISCPPTLTFDDGPITIPTMHDVVTHNQEFGCSKDYELWSMQDESVSNVLPVCVTPAFIAELKKANGEK